MYENTKLKFNSLYTVQVSFCLRYILAVFLKGFFCFKLFEAKLISRVELFVTPWTLTYWDPPSMGFSRQEYWSGLPFKIRSIKQDLFKEVYTCPSQASMFTLCPSSY